MSAILIRNCGNVSINNVTAKNVHTIVDVENSFDVSISEIFGQNVLHGVVAHQVQNLSVLNIEIDNGQNLLRMMQQNPQLLAAVSDIVPIMKAASSEEDRIDKLKRSGLGQWLVSQQFVAWAALALQIASLV